MNDIILKHKRKKIYSNIKINDNWICIKFKKLPVDALNQSVIECQLRHIPSNQTSRKFNLRLKNTSFYRDIKSPNYIIDSEGGYGFDNINKFDGTFETLSEITKIPMYMAVAFHIATNVTECDEIMNKKFGNIFDKPKTYTE